MRDFQKEALEFEPVTIVVTVQFLQPFIQDKYHVTCMQIMGKYSLKCRINTFCKVTKIHCLNRKLSQLEEWKNVKIEFSLILMFIYHKGFVYETSPQGIISKVIRQLSVLAHLWQTRTNNGLFVHAQTDNKLLLSLHLNHAMPCHQYQYIASRLLCPRLQPYQPTRKVFASQNLSPGCLVQISSITRPTTHTFHGCMFQKD